jgi:predicted MPP superfamily phosphohydrolase
MKKTKKIIFSIFTLCIIIVVFLIIQINWLQVTKYTVFSGKLPESFNQFTILQLSDLHSKSFGNNNQRLIRKIDELNPDIIVTTGDMKNSINDDGEVFLHLLEQLRPKYPIYYISGNHEQIAQIKASEYSSDGHMQYMEQIKELGITMLDDQSATVTINNDAIHLYGLVLPLRYYKAKDTPSYIGEKPFSKTFIENTIGQLDRKNYNILLTHNHLYFKDYADWGSDLTLAGHMHGGVIRIPFIGGVLSPERSFFPEYDAGKFTIEDSEMIVNRGLGNETVSFGFAQFILPRIFNRPELTMIELRVK